MDFFMWADIAIVNHRLRMDQRGDRRVCHTWPVGSVLPVPGVQWVALGGGVVGVMIACIRLYRMIFGRKNTE